MSIEPLESESPGDVRARVYHYRQAGESFAQIGAKLGIKPAKASRLYDAYVEGLNKYISAPDHKAALAEELRRIDTLQAAHWYLATEEHEVPMVVGRGENARVEMTEVGPDINSAKFVLDLMKHRADLLQLKLPNPTDHQSMQKVLIVSQSAADFLNALQEGQRGTLTSGHPDNVIVGEVETEEELA